MVPEESAEAEASRREANRPNMARNPDAVALEAPSVVSRDRWNNVNYLAVLNSLADAIVVGGVDDRIVHLNPAAERLLGWTSSEANGQPLTLLMPQRMHEAHERGFKRFIATYRAKTTELSV